MWTFLYFLLLQQLYLVDAIKNTTIKRLEGFYYYNPQGKPKFSTVLNHTTLPRVKKNYIDRTPTTTQIQFDEDASHLILSVYFSPFIVRETLLPLDNNWHKAYDDDIGFHKQKSRIEDDTIVFEIDNGIHCIQTFTPTSTGVAHTFTVKSPQNEWSMVRQMIRRTGPHVRINTRSELQFPKTTHKQAEAAPTLKHQTISVENSTSTDFSTTE